MNSRWKNWSEFTFCVRLEFVSLGPEMDGKIRDLKKWLFRLPEFRSIFLSILVNDSAWQNQISIEPSMPQSSSIGWYMKLFGGFELGFWYRGQSQTWTVSMGTYDLESGIGRIKSFSDVESHQSGIVSCEEILWTFLQLPVLCFTQLLVAFLSKFVSAPVDHVERRTGWIDEIKESLGENSTCFQKLFIFLHLYSKKIWLCQRSLILIYQTKQIQNLKIFISIE